MKYLLILPLSLLMFSNVPSVAQEVGEAIRIVNEVQANAPGNNRKLAVRNPVFARDTLKASENSHGEFILSDKSRIIVGPGSTVKLDDFLVSDSRVKSGTVKIAKGAFRFISGRGKKGKFSVTTPLSTIGIRGTIFDVYVKSGGVTDVILYSGKVEVCSRSGSCRIVQGVCDIVRVSSGNSIKFRKFLRSGDRKEENLEYDLTTRQTRFPPAWRAPTGSCAYRAALSNNLVHDSTGFDPDDNDARGERSETD